MAEKDGFEKAKEINIDTGKVKCSKCNRELRNFYEWIGDRKNILCEGCYQNLIFPFLNNSYEKEFY